MAEGQQEHLKKERQAVSNPFASYNEHALAGVGDLDRAELAEQPAYSRPMALNAGSDEFTQQEADTPELQDARDLAAGEQRALTRAEPSDGRAAYDQMNPYKDLEQ